MHLHTCIDTHAYHNASGCLTCNARYRNGIGCNRFGVCVGSAVGLWVGSGAPSNQCHDACMSTRVYTQAHVQSIVSTRVCPCMCIYECTSMHVCIHEVAPLLPRAEPKEGVAHGTQTGGAPGTLHQITPAPFAYCAYYVCVLYGGL